MATAVPVDVTVDAERGGGKQHSVVRPVTLSWYRTLPPPALTSRRAHLAAVTRCFITLHCNYGTDRQWRTEARGRGNDASTCDKQCSSEPNTPSHNYH